MTLTVRADGTGTANQVYAVWWNDYYNLLTGTMTDQPVSLKYTPGASGGTPVLLLTTNANAPLVQGYNGATQKYQIDANGNLSLAGKVTASSASAFGSGTTAVGVGGSVQGRAGLLDAGNQVIIMGNGAVNLTNDVYLDGTGTWRFSGTNPGHIMVFNGGTAAVYLSTGTPSAGAAITSNVLEGYFIKSSSNGGGAAGPHIWVGTTDPSGNATEGDIWIVG